MTTWKNIISLIASSVVVTIFLSIYTSLLTESEVSRRQEKDANRAYQRTHPMNDFDLPLIFIGGMPRSGTTLMRAMLEAHPAIRCGPETHVIPELMIKRNEWTKSPSEAHRLQEAGVQPEALNFAMGRFILEIIKNHAPPSTYYCNKDPFVLADMTYVHQLFPNSKFILMIRDGRATAHSIVSKKVAITAVDYKSYREVMKYWSKVVSTMYYQCQMLTEEVCLPVYYEQLVLHPVNNTKRIFQFLDIPWSSEVLHHERHVNETKLSQWERSTDQVQKPLYLDALTNWFGHVPLDVERDMGKLAPMLAVLGYDPYELTPKYGGPDDSVLGKLNL